MPPMAEKKPTDMRAAQPFHRCARPSHKMGWPAFPLPHKAKEPPPVGATGGVSVSPAAWGKKLEAWLKGSRIPKNSGMGYRMPPNVLCIDVDAYKGKGGDTLDEIAEELGIELPATWRHSARHDGRSGHYLFRIPEGLRWPGKIGDGIETVHAGHRYIVAAPSLHKDQGEDPDVDRYLWYAPDEEMDGEGHIEPPPVADLPELPEEWVEYLTSGRHAKHLRMKDFGTVAERDAAIVSWIEAHGDTMCNTMAGLVSEVADEMGPGAHDVMNSAMYRMAALAAEGHRGLAPALENVYEAFAGEVARDDRAGTARSIADLQREFLRSRDGAIRKVMSAEEEALFYGYPDECSCAEVGPDGAPVLQINTKSFRLSAILPKLYVALAPDANSIGLYVMGDEIVHFDGTAIRPQSVGSLRDFVDSRVFFYHNQSMGDGAAIPVSDMPPDRVLETLLKSNARALPRIDRYATAPVWVMVDGKPTLVAENGYHEASRTLFNLSSDLEGFSVAPDPSYKAAQLALSSLWAPFADFPFDGAGSRANFLAALLAVPTRPLVGGNAPVYLFHAPTPRTGKTLSVELVCSLVAGGTSTVDGVQRFFIEKYGDPGAEFAKVLAAAFRETPQIAFLDNADFYLSSSVFAGLLTSHPEFSARPLATSKTVNVRTDNTFFITSNNMTIDEENIPRMVSIRLDAEMERPDRGRTFSLRNPRAYVAEHRRELLEALHTLISYWVSVGCPEDDSIERGGFENWTRMMGGLLRSVGRDDLLANTDEFEMFARNEEESSIEVFVREWAEKFGVGPGSKVGYRELLTLESAGLLANLKPGESDSGNAKSLGLALRRYWDRVVAEHHLHHFKPRSMAVECWLTGPGFGAMPRRSRRRGGRVKIVKRN